MVIVRVLLLSAAMCTYLVAQWACSLLHLDQMVAGHGQTAHAVSYLIQTGCLKSDATLRARRRMKRCSVVAWNPAGSTQLVVGCEDDLSPLLQVLFLHHDPALLEVHCVTPRSSSCCCWKAPLAAAAIVTSRKPVFVAAGVGPPQQLSASPRAAGPREGEPPPCLLCCTLRCCCHNGGIVKFSRKAFASAPFLGF